MWKYQTMDCYVWTHTVGVDSAHLQHAERPPEMPFTPRQPKGVYPLQISLRYMRPDYARRQTFVWREILMLGPVCPDHQRPSLGIHTHTPNRLRISGVPGQVCSKQGTGFLITGFHPCPNRQANQTTPHSDDHAFCPRRHAAAKAFPRAHLLRGALWPFVVNNLLRHLRFGILSSFEFRISSFRHRAFVFNPSS